MVICGKSVKLYFLTLEKMTKVSRVMLDKVTKLTKLVLDKVTKVMLDKVTLPSAAPASPIIRLISWSVNSSPRGKGDYEMPKNVKFESKLDTDLYEFAKNKYSHCSQILRGTATGK